jgi:hypothetical protein
MIQHPETNNTLLIRIDERQARSTSDIHDIKMEVKALTDKTDRLEKRLDALTNKWAGATLILVGIGGIGTFILQKIIGEWWK